MRGLNDYVLKIIHGPSFKGDSILKNIEFLWFPLNNRITVKFIKGNQRGELSIVA